MARKLHLTETNLVFLLFLITLLCAEDIKQKPLGSNKEIGTEASNYHALLLKFVFETYPIRSPYDSAALTELPHVKLRYSGDSYRSWYSQPTDAERSDGILQYLLGLEHDLLRLSVREVTISGHNLLADWAWVSMAFRNLANLERVNWDHDAPVPLEVLESLETYSPSAKLHCKLGFPWIKSEEDGVLAKLSLNSVFPSLYSLKVSISNAYGARPNHEYLGFLYQVLMISPNVRELELSIHHRACVDPSGDQLWAFDFHSYAEYKFPPLESVKLAGYHFNAQANGNYERKRGNGKQTTNMEAWLEAMDWSRLHTFVADWVSPSAMRSLQEAALTDLRVLSLSGGDLVNAAAYQDFIAKTPSTLESISLEDAGFESLDGLLKAIIRRHGSSLKHLKVSQSGGRHKPRPLLNKRDISRLGLSCSSLESLEINVNRTANWDYEYHDVFTPFPSLTQLTLRFEPETFSWSDRRSSDPFINAASSLVLFRSLRRHKVGQPFQEFRVYVGIWDRHWESKVGGHERMILARYICHVKDGAEICDAYEEIYPQYQRLFSMRGMDQCRPVDLTISET